MALSVMELTAIDALLADANPDAISVAALRAQFPQLSWTLCDASDVTETPFRSYAAVDVHLLSTKDHCAQITVDPMSATGVILARHGADA